MNPSEIDKPAEEVLSQDSDLTSRVRSLTERGTELYVSQRQKHVETLQSFWIKCESFIQDISQASMDINTLMTLQERINVSYERYRRQSDIYMEFLRSCRTKDSISDIEALKEIYSRRQNLVDTSIKRIRDFCVSLSETTSMKSFRSKATTHHSRSDSGTASTARQKRAKAEAAKAKIAFAEQQTLIKKQQASMQAEQVQMEAKLHAEQAQMESKIKTEKAKIQATNAALEADLDLLATKGEAAAAEAEALALEEDGNRSQDLEGELPLPKMDSNELVQNYVNQQAELTVLPEMTNTNIFNDNHHAATTAGMLLPLPTTTSATLTRPKLLNTFTATSARNTTTYPYGPPYFPSNYGAPVQTSMFSPPVHKLVEPPVIARLDSNAPIFVPSVDHFPSSTFKRPDNHMDSNQMSDMTKFLLRKDLLFSRLTTFNDKAESYHAWKASFKGIMEDLQVSDAEQIDLLVKWLGTESSLHAVSIRSSNAGNPKRGLQRLWERLDERYGSPEMAEASLKAKLANFPKMSNKDTKRLYELSDILSEIESYKEDKKFQCLLGYFDSSSGIRPIVAKLPYALQEKWTSRASSYIERYGVAYPPFVEFVSFIRQISKTKNHPGFMYDLETTTNTKTLGKQQFPTKGRVSVNKTTSYQHDQSQRQDGNLNSLDRCIIHKTKHSLDECRGFRAKSVEERKKLLKENNICYKCCASNSHKSRDCSVTISCKECGSKQHTTALHVTKSSPQPRPYSSSHQPSQQHGGEPRSSDKSQSVSNVNSSCTEVCNSYSGKSCAKILQVNVFQKDNPSETHKMYAIIDDQSNRSLASPAFFDMFNILDKPENYTLSTCSGIIATSGRRGRGFVVESVHRDIHLSLPTLIECDHIPDNRDEIPTPQVVQNHFHLHDLAGTIQPLDDSCQILLLIGRDLPVAHHVLDQKVGSDRDPYAQQLKLGWVIVGETCLDRQHKSSHLSVMRTHVLPSGRPSTLQPCENQFKVKEQLSRNGEIGVPCKPAHTLEFNVFERTKDDDKLGMSHEDKQFLKQMNSEFKRDSTGSWVAPLPFRSPRQSLPNNREQAVQRAKYLDSSLRRNPTKREHMVEFMQKILDNNHAEVAPPLQNNEECWYLPLFGVYHPKKPDQIRGVFDSSAKFNGISLNNVLLT